jgi:MtN3 and saliva related transmembrane protein
MNSLAILTTIFGIAMSFGYFTQTYKIIKTKSVKGVSLATYIFFLIGIAMWFVYGLTIKDFPIIISNAVFLVDAIAVIITFLVYRKNKK